MWILFFCQILQNIQEMLSALTHSLKYIDHLFSDYLFQNALANPTDKLIALNWVRTFVPSASEDFSRDWQNEAFLTAVMEHIIPASCLRPTLSDKEHEFENLEKVLNALTRCYHLKSVPDVFEIVDCPPCFEGKLITFLLELKEKVESCPLNNLKAKSSTDECSPNNCQPKPCFAKGVGLTSGYAGHLMKFNVFFKTAHNMDLVVEIKCDSGLCRERITNLSPKRKFPCLPSTIIAQFFQNEQFVPIENYWQNHEIRNGNTEKDILFGYDIQTDRVLIGYIPFEPGEYAIRIFWHGQQIQGSPYFINVENLADKPKKNNVTKVKQSSLHDASFQTLDNVKGLTTQMIRFKDNEGAAKKFGKIVRRKVLRYIVNVCGKDVVVDAESSDMLAPALLKLDYQSHANPFHCRRNSWGFVGDAERKKSLVRQFGVDLTGKDILGYHRRSSVQLDYGQNNKRLENFVPRKKSSALITVTEGSGKNLEERNETTIQNDQYENEVFDAENGDIEVGVESNENNVSKAAESESDIKEKHISISVNQLRTKPFVTTADTTEKLMSPFIAPSPTPCKNVQNLENLEDGKVHVVVCQHTIHSESIEQILEKLSIGDRENGSNFNGNVNSNKSTRLPTLKTSPVKRSKLSKARRIQKTSFKKSPRELFRNVENKIKSASKRNEISKDKESATSVDSEGASASEKPSSLHNSESKFETEQSEIYTNQSVDAVFRRSLPNHEQLSSESNNDQRVSLDNGLETLLLNPGTEEQLFCSETKEQISLKNQTISNDRFTSQTFDCESGQITQEQFIPCKRTDSLTDCCASNNEVPWNALESVATHFTSDSLQSSTDSFAKLIKPVRDIVRDIEGNTDRNYRSEALRNNFYSASLHFPPLAANYERTRVKTRIRQWETTSSLPSTPFRSKEVKRITFEKQKLAVSSDVQSKALFFERMQRQSSGNMIKNCSKPSEFEINSLQHQDQCASILKRCPTDELLDTKSSASVSSYAIANLNPSQSFDLWYLSKQRKRYRKAGGVGVRLDRRSSDPGPLLKEKFKDINVKFMPSNFSQSTSFSCEFSSFDNPFEQEDESEDEYIDDEIPDYAAMCSTDYPSETGHLFESIQGSKSRADECLVYGSGIYYGRVAVKNHFQVLTKGAGKGNLSVSLRGSSVHDVANINVTYARNDIYHVTYQVMEPGYYLISVRWCDVAVQGSPFVCKVTY